MSAVSTARAVADSTRLTPIGSPRRRALRLVERNAVAQRRQWYLFLTGFLEPVLYLLSIGIGVGKLVGKLPAGGHLVDYQEFVAPGLLAASAMNGAVFDTTFMFFIKFKYAHTYDAALATPIGVGDVARGEVAWTLARGTIYSAAFLGAMIALGLTPSWWALLAIPAATLIAFGFAGAGLAGTTWMRSWVDFDFVNLAIIPMFLFSATFFPLSRYPGALGWLVRATPLYQGVALERALVLGTPSWATVGHALYLAVIGGAGVRLATRRLTRLLPP
jgi:lipooligosaccharide transport system permease protein